MRAVFTCIVLSVILFASSERKIIVGSFATEQGAQHALKQFQKKLSTEFLAAQERLNFAVVARPSGRQYIIAIEPFPSYKEAKKVKKMLPKKYASAFINKYTPPATSLSPVQQSHTVVEKEKEAVNTATVTEASAPEAVLTQEITKAAPIAKESNTTHKSDKNVTITPIVHETLRVPSESKEASFIIDAVTMKLIDAKKAYYAVEGQTYGIMSPSGKFAFADKEVAEEFVKQYGGRVVDYATMQQLESKASQQ